ncbi:hypothetical protein BJ138DRAFT_1139619 [Hygrophoropsis aurantiaca]|uniref:Uncharacterized protein n=1 Tax=Hygrophoropsis aurantiaca TaxID=72124 RepID=A0ACB8ATP1_9AGAM|nr:hypothetical protein BJ138DRAFT_1139619 [Hygrophoropsis aurantiaca]
MDSKQSNDLDADIARLNVLLSRDNLNPREEIDLAELLARLESADNVAKDVEGRLDDLLGTLDSLLTSLENKQDGEVHNTDGLTSSSISHGQDISNSKSP